MDDTIYRQDAIDAFWKLDIELKPSAIDAITGMLKKLPSAQPEILACGEGKLNVPDTNVRDCSDCIKHGGDWDCDYVHCHKGESAQPEPLTDKEQRIFLAAMGREEKICEEVDRNYVREPYEDSLVRVCKEIRRKVKGALWT